MDPEYERSRRHFLKLSNHHFHDATVGAIRVLPANSKAAKAKLEVALSYPHVDLEFLVTFHGCTNLSLELDFDVLADQLPYNTAVFEVKMDVTTVRAMMMAQVESWNVEYADGGSREAGCVASTKSPLKKKLRGATRLKHYRLRFFGGALSLLASSFRCSKKVRLPND